MKEAYRTMKNHYHLGTMGTLSTQPNPGLEDDYDP